MNPKLRYFLDSALKTLRGQGGACPSCGGRSSAVVQRKYLVTTLRRCADCELLFRAPTTSAAEASAFYQQEYAEGFTTDCPDDARLSALLATGFAGGEKDYAGYIDVLRAAGARDGDRLFDFGCSWGYGSWQLARAGFEVEAFELSRPRAAYAREKLGIRVHDELPDVVARFDVFFSAHVIEHVPSVRAAMDYAMRVLKPGGLFVAFTPNGSGGYRRVAPEHWSKAWGRVHPNFLDDRYYAVALAGKRHLICARPYPLNDIAAWRNGGGFDAPAVTTDGGELLALAIR